MAKPSKFDFGGYATKANLKCTDGRTIMQGAFKDCDGKKVPLVWEHIHNDPANILGYAYLEHRADGVYCYGVLNDTPGGKNAKMLVQHGDITSLSIYANQLVEKQKQVFHGVIREVSLVLGGANPGAEIQQISVEHSDGSVADIDEAIIFSGLEFDEKSEPEDDDKNLSKPEPKKKIVIHADSSASDDGDETIGDVFNTLSEKQKTAVYAIIGEIVGSDEEGDSAKQSSDEGDKGTMKHNVFSDANGNKVEKVVLTSEEFQAIIATAKESGSLKQAVLAHAVTYGIENIDYLFPDAKTLTNVPTFIKRDTGWVATVLNGTFHSPFSRIKTVQADITLDTARALGYVKGALKREEFFGLIRRTTTPTTIYKKQKLDRDDVIDIVDFDVVAWMKGEMRFMLDEEIARAVLIGDGRSAESEDKISETNIRPIWTDDDLYAHKVTIAYPVLPATTNTVEQKIEAIIRGRVNYKGTGNPVMYTSSTFLSDMLLSKDTTGRRIYNSLQELQSVLRVSDIIEVPQFENLTREVTGKTRQLLAIIVNLRDYCVGADKGGQVSMFDDFDIDYNQQKYLIETRCSGALTLPKSALVVEEVLDA